MDDNKRINILDLFDEYILPISIKIDQIASLSGMLYGNYFLESQKNLFESEEKILSYQLEYKNIQILVDIINEFAHDAKKLMEELNDINLHDIQLLN